MAEWIAELQKHIRGEVLTDNKTLEEYSTDASIFKVRPQVVVFPKDHKDVKELVKFVSDNKEKYPELSLTARSGGTDMTGGPLNEGIICVFTKHFNHIKEVAEDHAVIQPGVYYRDLEKEMDKIGVMYPSYPASKSICALGGIIANNSGGEKTLTYGKTQDHVRRLKVVLADGNEYEFKEISKKELDKKMKQKDFEGKLYKKVYGLIEENYDKIKAAKPDVSKNSAGYYLWDVWDRKKKKFDMSKLFVGSQGTLGIWTEAEVDLVKKKKHSRLVTVFLRDIKRLAELVNIVLPYKPESLEAFDDETLKLALKFMPGIAKRVGKPLTSLLWGFRHEAAMTLKYGFPKFIILIEITGDDLKEMEKRLDKLSQDLHERKVPHRVLQTEEEGQKYWTMRRESFALLRSKVKDKKATPFIDDFDVKPEHLPDFLPELYALLEEYEIKPTLAGHAGSGNFHIIPLMDLSKESERKKIPEVEEKFDKLVVKYHGSITAEHNDGLIRSPYLKDMYGTEITELFEQVKDIFDPKCMFNPGKKVRSDLNYAMEHINTEFG